MSKSITHMKKMKRIVGPSGLETAVPLCDPRKWWLVASYNWKSVNCKKCLKKRKVDA